jgi:protein TonB
MAFCFLACLLISHFRNLKRKDMKALKQIISFFINKKENKPKSKKDANIPYNATLYFQTSLIISITITALVINSAFKVNTTEIAGPDYRESEEIVFHEFYIKMPEEPKIEELKPEPKKIINPVKINLSEEPKVTDKVIETDPEPKIIHTDKPLVPVQPLIPNPAPAPDNTTYGIMGVERVPVFPGCEALTDNTQRRDCMSTEIGKLINRRFNTELANDLGLKGNQRIYVSFVINKNGQVVNTKVRAPHPRLEKEAERVVKLIPKMMPGLQNNQEVDVMFTLPIVFNVIN